MLKTIGQSLFRKEGIPKVTGEAIYVADMHFENCLYGATIRSAVPRGRLKQIRFQPGMAWEQFTVVVAADIPGINVVTLIDTDQPVLASQEIRHIAEPVALIAHPDKDVLQDALRHIELDIDELPPVLTIEEALRGDNIQYGIDNVFKSYRVQSGEPDAMWALADVVVEETYRTGPQEQLYIEPQGIIARVVPGEQATIWGSMQCPYYVQKALAPLLNFPPDRVRIIQTETGGGFGGKEEYPNIIAGHAALLSWKAGGRPVRMIYDRREDLLATTKRHPSRTHIKAGFKPDGTLLALDIDILLDGGAYATLSSVVLSRATLHAWGPYRCGNTRVRSRVVMTNSVPYGAFRGFGAPQSIFAIEMHMNRAAQELRMDGAELRRRNFLRKGDRMPTGQLISEDIDLEKLMNRALELSDYRNKRAAFTEFDAKSPDLRKGIAVSVFFHGSGFTGSGEVRLNSQVALQLTRDGVVDVLAANVEYGQGTNTTLAQIVAETCGIPPEWVRVQQPDTAVVPDSGPTVASRTTMIVGKLIERAAVKLLRRLAEAAGLKDSSSPEEFRAAAREYLRDELRVSERYQPPEGVLWDDETYQGDAYAAYAWSCDVAEVEVNLLEYAPRVTNFVSLVECGRVINPVLAAGQIEGGIVQGIGYALYENVVLERGAMKNHQYTNYIIPTTADVPDIHVEFMPFPYSNPGPYFAKGIGEMPIDGPAPAVASAVAQALGGKFMNEIPLLPETVMRAVES